MEDGQGLWILAAVVIAFVNWLSTTLKEKAAAREIEKRRARGELIETDETEDWPSNDPTVYEEPAATPDAQLRAFFDSLANKPTPTQAPAPAPAQPAQQRRTPAPPPRPEPEAERWRAPEVKRAKLSKAEREALENLQNAKAPRRARRSAARGDAPHPLVAKLRQASGAREAIILSEVLGKPKGLADA